ncbi:hypothetical protein Tco_1115862 [Tanacetum coccineum]
MSPHVGDAFIVGHWSLPNAKNLSIILTCFHPTSGLKVNFSKSKLFGIEISSSELNSIASSTGCQPSLLPCTYLGLSIDANMSRCAIGLKLKSILRNFFWGGNSDTKKIAWIAWDKVIGPREQGGLGIGSLKIFNQAMLA